MCTYIYISQNVKLNKWRFVNDGSSIPKFVAKEV